MRNILVTGGKGQLASCIKDLQNTLINYNFIYVDYDELDITKEDQVVDFFKKTEFSYCINCAAYTAVDKAETEIDLVTAINENGVHYLAEACKKYNTVLIQISTDFVFDGKSSQLYTEGDKTLPLSVYGQTKLNGEKAALTIDKCFVIRTSWLYSEHGNNFLKTMLKLGKVKDELSIVCDQIGTPTYARDLAGVILKLVKSENKSFGVYHYSNEGVASWYDFAKAIFDSSKIDIKLIPINSEAYPTPAKRPSFSVMDKAKIKNTLNIEIPYWKDSLEVCFKRVGS